jgi:nucleoid-associated protein YgaU
MAVASANAGVNGATTSQRREETGPLNIVPPPVVSTTAPAQTSSVEMPSTPRGNQSANGGDAGDAPPLTLRPPSSPPGSDPLPLALRGSLEPSSTANGGADAGARPTAPAGAPAETKIARLVPPVPPRAEHQVAPVEPNSQRRPPPDLARPRAEQFVRVVRAGDNLWTLTEAVYGYVNPDVIRRVQDANPHIRNINWLSPGQEIVFPRTPMSAPSRPAGVFSFSRGLREPSQD